jgi:hypothetical protein
MTVAVVAARLKDAVNLYSVCDDLVSVAGPFEPAHIWVWMKTPPGTG